jgi:hypothetical protein
MIEKQLPRFNDYFFSVFFLLKTRIAHLLGVAGADIPVNDIKKLMQPFLVSSSWIENDFF